MNRPGRPLTVFEDPKTVSKERKMRPTIDVLLKKANSGKCPARWRALYDKAMDDFEENGLKMVLAHYYSSESNKSFDFTLTNGFGKILCTESVYRRFSLAEKPN